MQQPQNNIGCLLYTSQEPYVALIKRLALNDKLDFDTAKLLIAEYRKTLKQSK